MNLGYENSEVPVRVKLHCVEHADIDDQESALETLYLFNDYKPSYAEIRWRGAQGAWQLASVCVQGLG